MELIHERTLKALDEMSQRFFWMNKKLDRMKSVLDVDFTMPILSGLVHENLAHEYPLIADEVNDIQEQFNYSANYLGVEGATEDYNSVIEMMEQLHTWTIETNNMLNNTMKVAFDEGDMNVYWKLVPISVEYSKYISNSILLKDKAMGYGNNLMAMDKDSRAWWKL